MTFLATNVTPADAYATVKRAAVQMKLNLASMIGVMAAGNVDYEFLRAVYSTLSNANAQFTTLSATPGLAEYAKTAEDDPAYNVTAEFAAMQTEISSAITWLDANIPTNVTAKPPADWGNSDTIIADTFTPAQTAGLRSVLSAVNGTIS